MNTFLTYSGLIGSYFILCGIIKFYFYFKKFGISILRFIDISEVLTLFMDNLIAYFFVVIPTSLTLYYIHRDVMKKIAIENINPVSVLSTEWKFLTIAAITVLVFTTIYFIRNKGISWREYLLLFILVIIFFIVLPVCFYISFALSNYFELGIHPSQIIFILLAFTLLVFSISTAYNEAKKVINEGYFDGVEVEFKDGSKVLSNRNQFYIGMTKNYCFFYDKLTKICSIKKIESVVSFKFPKRSKRLGLNK